jgi:hypothetical protein
MSASGTPRDARLAALSANRALATVAAVALGLAGLAAACAPAPGRPGGTPRAVASPAEVDAVLQDLGASGPAVAVWVWTPGFVDGDPGAEPLAHALTWIAPTGPAADPDGTVTVWQDPAGTGAVELAARDDDAELAAALGTVGPDATLVSDRSDWLVVTGDRVRSLVRPPRTELAGTVTVAEYREVLAARARDTAPGTGPGSDSVGG